MNNTSNSILNDLLKQKLGTITVTETEEAIAWFSNDKDTKPLKVADPFATAVCSWRAWHTDPDNAYRWKTLENCDPTEEDYALAKEMCVYYRDKLGMRALMGNPMTKFQQTLYSILVEGHTDLQECHRGVLHKLPYFYAEDMARKELVDRFTGMMNLQSISGLENNPITKYLTPVKRLLCSRKSGETVEYWFTDNQGYPVLFRMMYNAALRNMFDGLFELPGVTLTGIYRTAELRMAGFVHLMINNPKLVLN